MTYKENCLKIRPSHSHFCTETGYFTIRLQMLESMEFDDHKLLQLIPHGRAIGEFI